MLSRKNRRRLRNRITGQVRLTWPHLCRLYPIPIKLKEKNNNVISFNYRNIIITYISKHSLLEEYNKLKQCGDNLSFTLICKFSYDSYNDKYQLLVEDWDYEACNDSVKVNPFGSF